MSSKASSYSSKTTAFSWSNSAQVNKITLDEACFICQSLKTATKNKMSVHFVIDSRGQTEKKTRVYLHLWESEASIPFTFFCAAGQGDVEKGR